MSLSFLRVRCSISSVSLPHPDFLNSGWRAFWHGGRAEECAHSPTTCDPAEQQCQRRSGSTKRYGDGFEEQQLVDDQLLALTGRRYLDGYSDTQDEYAALMTAGVAFAQQYQLTPGVALTAAQMARLTTNIVWLTPETVTLPDGTTTQALVPEVYL